LNANFNLEDYEDSMPDVLAEEELQVSNFKSFEYNINYFIILIPYHFNSELLNLLNLNLLNE
jgi:hypothetical protein